ncbi:hypothetical protein WA158_000943 [Blastocystis sp. Blastoise]
MALLFRIASVEHDISKNSQNDSVDLDYKLNVHSDYYKDIQEFLKTNSIVLESESFNVINENILYNRPTNNKNMLKLCENIYFLHRIIKKSTNHLWLWPSEKSRYEELRKELGQSTVTYNSTDLWIDSNWNRYRKNSQKLQYLIILTLLQKESNHKKNE